MTPQSEDEEEVEEDTGPALTPVRPGVTTAQLAKEAAASAGITKKRPGEDRNTKEPPAKKTTTARAVGRRESVQVVEAPSNGFKIPFKNSTKFPKNTRPDHLQDDDIFNLLSLGDVTNQMAMWAQTKAVMEANSLKIKKAEKGVHKTNTNIKKIIVEEGEDDSTTVFHPQRYKLRPPVV